MSMANTLQLLSRPSVTSPSRLNLISRGSLFVQTRCLFLLRFSTFVGLFLSMISGCVCCFSSSFAVRNCLHGFWPSTWTIIAIAPNWVMVFGPFGVGPSGRNRHRRLCPLPSPAITTTPTTKIRLVPSWTKSKAN